jgi:nitrite reductase/ring-hydroxylating ferredoxin subunit
MSVKVLKRNVFQRILGICATKLPINNDCWSYSDGKLIIDTGKAPELSKIYGGLRIEGNSIPERVLVVRGEDDNYYAVRNKCTHAGRRLDPVPDSDTVQCCSMGRSTFKYNGEVIKASSEEPLPAFPVEVQDGQLVISIGTKTE